ncbi:MAG TPA: type IV secretory system conjugative DNA transfer family protein, partial [Steroidobacteraceae bacterium]|nr:type IV secretory system conjugative DNA transfer family protein [Steroidobacteraceae bacterium]
MLTAPIAIAWLASQAAAEVASGRPLQLSLPQAIGVLARLPRHLDTPRLAWPPADRSPLPGTVALDAVLLIACATVLGLLAAGVYLVVGLIHRRDRDRAARWASDGELGQLRTDGPQPGRVMLGEHSGRLIATERRTSVLVVGPAQSGKSTGVIVPAVLQWQGPVLSTSVKADVVHDTHHARSQLGEVLIFDPTSSTGLEHTPWSPVSASRTWAGARRTAANLLGVGDSGSAHSTDETFWRPAGARYLAPLLLAAAHAE